MPYGDKHIPEERLKEMLDELRQHYGEPVKPVSEYCQVFYDWMDKALPDAWKRYEEHDSGRNLLGVPALYELKEHIFKIKLAIVKSNYLWRRLYGDGLHRTEECPKHKGHWSGYASMRDDEYTCEYGCMHGYDQTGWLGEEHEYVEPPPDQEPEYQDGKLMKMGHTYLQGRCHECGGTREKGKHIEP